MPVLLFSLIKCVYLQLEYTHEDMAKLTTGEFIKKAQTVHGDSFIYYLNITNKAISKKKYIRDLSLKIKSYLCNIIHI